MTPEKPIQCPFTILVDQREKAPYRFTGIRADADKQGRPVVVETKIAFLKTGDYSIEGLEKCIAIERKSLEDLYSTLGQHRDRFEEEHDRLMYMNKAAVVIEADLSYAMANPPTRSRLTPKSVYRTYLAWQWRYGVPWIWAGSRVGAEKTTFHLLRMFWESLGREGLDHEREGASGGAAGGLEGGRAV